MQLAVALERYLDQSPKSPFAWPTANCCHFVAGWIKAVRGFDPMSSLRVTPTQVDAKRLIVEMGGDLEAATSACLGCASVPSAFAQLGDVVYIKQGEDSSLLGICAGLYALAIDESGAVLNIEMQHALRAWRTQEITC